MTLLLSWIICVAISGFGLIGMAVWYRRHPDPVNWTEPITLLDIFQGLGLALCPVVNMLVGAGLVVWFMNEVAPKVVLFGAKK